MILKRNFYNRSVCLPSTEDIKDEQDRETVKIFLYCYKDMCLFQENRRVLFAITKTAALTGCCTVMISKKLVNKGLRAHRLAFPDSFLILWGMPLPQDL